MTCEKCSDIHEAQREGKTQNECKCTCHDMEISFYGELTNTGTSNINYIWTTSTGPCCTCRNPQVNKKNPMHFCCSCSCHSTL